MVTITIVVVPLAILAAYAALLATWHVAERRGYHAGRNAGYLLGRRDERAVQSAEDSSAHYPMILETLADGTTRRLDR